MNIQAMMKQAQKMQDEIEKNKIELAKKIFTVEKQGVTVEIAGDKKIKKISINEILVDPEDKDILEDLMIIAINDAYKMVDEAEKELMPSNPSGMPF